MNRVIHKTAILILFCLIGGSLFGQSASAQETIRRTLFLGEWPDFAANQLAWDGQVFTQTIQLPASWQVVDDVELSLSVTVQADAVPQDAALALFWDNVPLEVVPLTWVGKQAHTVLLPQPLWQTGGGVLRAELVYPNQCLPPDLNVFIEGDSMFTFLYTEQPTSPTLADWPRPFVSQPFAHTAVVVALPNAPSVADLRTGLAVMAQLGQLLPQPATLLTASQLTTQIRAESHLIVVGHDSLWDVHLPPPAAQPQVLPSPWNAQNALLVLAEETAVLPATVTDTPLPVLPINEVHALAASGFADQRLEAGISDRVAYTFMLTDVGQITGDAMMALHMSYGGALDEGETAVVKLNGAPIAAIALPPAAEEQTVTHRVDVLPTVLSEGVNVLAVESALTPLAGCDAAQQRPYVTVDASSTLWLPTSPANEPPPLLAGFAAYPRPFSAQPHLDDLLFVLPSADSAAWTVAGQIAFDLGQRAFGSAAEPQVAWATAVPDDLLPTHHLLLVGTEAEMAFRTALDAALAATAVASPPQVTHTLPPDAGYVQLFPSPWQPTRYAVLNLSAETAVGLQAAGVWLAQTLVAGDVLGNFALVAPDDTATQVITYRSTQLDALGDPYQGEPEGDTNETAVRVRYFIITVAVLLAGLLIVAMNRWRQRPAAPEVASRRLRPGIDWLLAAAALVVVGVLLSRMGRSPDVVTESATATAVVPIAASSATPTTAVTPTVVATEAVQPSAAALPAETASLMPTPVPTNTATAVPDVAPTATATVAVATASRSASLFARPEIDSAQLTFVDPGEAVVVNGRSDNASWLFVETANGVRGWVAISRLTYDGNIADLPITTETIPVADPASPVPTAAAGGNVQPLTLDFWPQVGQYTCSASAWTQTLFMEGQGGSGRYTYFINGQQVGGPTNGSISYSFSSVSSSAEVKGGVVSGDLRYEVTLFVTAPNCQTDDLLP